MKIVYEGKIWNTITRFQQPKSVQDRIDFLKSLIKYYIDNQNNPYEYIHPSEKPKEKIVSKLNYNKLKKLYISSNKKRKFPDYPKSGKLTKHLNILFSEFNINPYNSKKK